MSVQNRIIVGVLLGAVAVAGFWFGVLAPKREDVAGLKVQIQAAEGRRDAALSSAATAEQSRRAYHKDYATLAKLGKAVPGDDDVASLVYQLETIAKRNKIDFRAVKLTGAATVQPTTTIPATPGNPAADTLQDGAQPAAATPVVTQAPPGTVVGTAGLLTVPFTFTFDGGYLAMQRFLKAIDGLATTKKQQIRVNGRLLTVDGFSLTAGIDGLPALKAVVSATAYLVPPSDSAASATAQAPAGAPAPSSTTNSLRTDQGDGR